MGTFFSGPSISPDAFIRYLAAKKTVDDRALNRHVWDALQRAVAERPQPLQVLEIGAGIGTMIERTLAAGLWQQAGYTALDVDATLLATVRLRLPIWATAHGWEVMDTDEGLRLYRHDRRVDVRLEAADCFDFARAQAGRRSWDVLLAHAFLDLVDLPTALPLFLELLRPGGLFYFTLTFDGVTAFQPELDPGFDAWLEGAYHGTMDERRVAGRPSGDSRSGRHLLALLMQMPVTILAAGPSDWLVWPQGGRYPADEAFFLHTIVDTVGRALTGHPATDPQRLAAWLTTRHAQIERGELIYLAHQLDVLGRVETANVRPPQPLPR
jgi:SAM-dependent methyltransferase